jgi:nucleotide-binding universal stress UspA family protein
VASLLIICFDGSPGAEQAVAKAGGLFPGTEASVVHVWHRPHRYGLGYAWVPTEIQADLDRWAEEQAVSEADRGVALAASAGLTPTAVVREAKRPVWRELLDAADASNADVIIVGSRGFGEVGAWLLGSTSSALAHHSARPLLIVPAPEAD